MNAYIEQKNRHQEEANALPLHFAFGQKQIDEKIKELRLSKDPKKRAKQIVSIGCGGFVLAEDYPKVKETFERHDRERKEAIEADATGDGYIFDMFNYELANHEYGYTGDPSDTLMALGITYNDLENNPALANGFTKACKSQMDGVVPQTDNCTNETYNCDGCVNNGDCIEQGIDGRPRWEETQDEIDE